MMKKLERYKKRFKKDIFAPKEIKSLTEAGLSRIYQHDKSHGFCMMSAWVSTETHPEYDEIIIKKRNKRSEKELTNELQHFGLGFIKSTGQYGGFEHSVFIPYIPVDERNERYEGFITERSPDSWEEFKKIVIEIASDKKIDQESILLKNPDSDVGYLYFCKDSSWSSDKKGDIKSVGKLNFISIKEIQRKFQELRDKAHREGKDPDEVEEPMYSQLRTGNREVAFKYGNFFDESEIRYDVFYPTKWEKFDLMNGLSRYGRQLYYKDKKLVEKIKQGTVFGDWILTRYEPIWYDDLGGLNGGYAKLVNQETYDEIHITNDKALRNPVWFVRINNRRIEEKKLEVAIQKAINVFERGKI